MNFLTVLTYYNSKTSGYKVILNIFSNIPLKIDLVLCLFEIKSKQLWHGHKNKLVSKQLLHESIIKVTSSIKYSCYWYAKLADLWTCSTHD